MYVIIVYTPANFSVDEGSNGGGLTTGAVIGIVLGCTVGIGIIVLLLLISVCYCRRNYSMCFFSSNKTSTLPIAYLT